MDTVDVTALEETLANARRALLDARTPAGHWEGELSSSALSTATAVFAISLHGVARQSAGNDPLVAGGLQWLAAHQNEDGGWGDTVKSFSNISTTALCWAAFGMGPQTDENYEKSVSRAGDWLTRHAGGIDPGHLIPAIIARYGKDHTFSVPILAMCALAGRLGNGPGAWKRIPQLPFELAGLPQRWFKWFRLPVVSYALPALIAIGLVRHRRRPTRNPAARLARRLARGRALRLLEKIQPSSGGFLEATPLTSFVVMSLVGAGLADHPVVSRGMEFLARSARVDGSWAIDTNLATWVTTLSVNALALDPEFEQILSEPERLKIRDWLLDQQYTAEHPYTLADPGGWAWTNLPGGVPDADDTAGALLALKNLALVDDRTRKAAALGVTWLLGLQNRDGGIPTFCRGWGKLPFDRSSADLTAHAIRALGAWFGKLETALPFRRFRSATIMAFHFLYKAKCNDGSWLPLWFGNQQAKGDENPTYGTARVLLAIADASMSHAYTCPDSEPAVAWLLNAQGPDGGWGSGDGTPSSIEETALAVEAMAVVRRYLSSGSRGSGRFSSVNGVGLNNALARGVAWLIEHTDRGTRFDPSPIGFFFAKLWYFERLYPLIFTVAALKAARKGIAECGLRNAD